MLNEDKALQLINDKVANPPAWKDETFIIHYRNDEIPDHYMYSKGMQKNAGRGIFEASRAQAFLDLPQLIESEGCFNYIEGDSIIVIFTTSCIKMVLKKIKKKPKEFVLITIFKLRRQEEIKVFKLNSMRPRHNHLSLLLKTVL